MLWIDFSLSYKHIFLTHTHTIGVFRCVITNLELFFICINSFEIIICSESNLRALCSIVLYSRFHESYKACRLSYMLGYSNPFMYIYIYICVCVNIYFCVSNYLCLSLFVSLSIVNFPIRIEPGYKRLVGQNSFRNTANIKKHSFFYPSYMYLFSFPHCIPLFLSRLSLLDTHKWIC